MSGESMEEVSDFRYLGVDISANGRLETELNHRLTEARKSAGVLNNIWKK